MKDMFSRPSQHKYTLHTREYSTHPWYLGGRGLVREDTPVLPEHSWRHHWCFSSSALPVGRLLLWGHYLVVSSIYGHGCCLQWSWLRPTGPLLCERGRIKYVHNAYRYCITYIHVACCVGDFKGKTVRTFMMCAHFPHVHTLHLMLHWICG